MSFRRTTLTGLLVILPVLVTFWVIGFIFGVVDRSITPVIFQIVRFFGPSAWVQQAWVNYIAPIVSMSVAVALVYVIGLIGGNVLGRQLLRGVERLLLRVPIVRGIYSSTRQFIDTFSRPEGRAFSGVGLVEFPRPGCWTLCFITGRTHGEVHARLNRDLVSVFVPTTPNPTGGYLMFVPSATVVRLDMSIDDALKMIISCGVLTPDFPATAAASDVPATTLVTA